MKPSKILFLFPLLAVMFACKAKKKGSNIVDVSLGEIHLPNQEAENDFNKGLFYIRQENYSAAKDFFLRADEESPNTPIILNAIGNCLDRTGNPSQGFIYFKKALQIDSNFMRTYVNYGCSLNNSRRFDEAETIFRLGLRKRPMISLERSSLYCNLADTYYHRSQNAIALSLLDSAKMGLSSNRLYDVIVKFENKIKHTTYLPPTN
jgi:tetratricopeptide (TPR) repeat protein